MSPSPVETPAVAAAEYEVILYMGVIVASLATYEYIITIPQEVMYAWSRSPIDEKRKWTPVKWMYLIQRYLPLVDATTLILYSSFTPNPSPKLCRTTYLTLGWLYGISMIMSEILLSLRVIALWSGNKRVKHGIVVLFCLTMLPGLGSLGIFLSSIVFVPSPVPRTGCYIGGSNALFIVFWIALIVYDGVNMVLMIIPCVRDYRFVGQTALWNSVYRDGILYYILLFTLSLLNLMSTLALPQGMIDLLYSLERVMHSVITSRVLYSISDALGHHQ